MYVRAFGIATILFALAAGLPASAAMCADSNVASVTDRGSAGTNPCVLPRRSLDVEAAYYQNASLIGGTALASYPLGELRYGLGFGTEIIATPASAIAKSSNRRGGTYTWEANGIGLKTRIARTGRFSASLRADYAPVLNETATISTRPRFDVALAGRQTLSPAVSLSGSLGEVSFSTVHIVHSNVSAAREELALSDQVRNNTKLTVIVAAQSNLSRDSNGQTTGGFAVQQSFSRRFALDADLGTAFNSAAQSKAHYLEAGLAYLL